MMPRRHAPARRCRVCTEPPVSLGSEFCALHQKEWHGSPELEAFKQLHLVRGTPAWEEAKAEAKARFTARQRLPVQLANPQSCVHPRTWFYLQPIHGRARGGFTVRCQDCGKWIREATRAEIDEAGLRVQDLSLDPWANQGPCAHKETRFFKVGPHVAELCTACEKNARGPGIWVPQQELVALDINPANLTPAPSLVPAQAKLPGVS